MMKLHLGPQVKPCGVSAHCLQVQTDWLQPGIQTDWLQPGIQTDWLQPGIQIFSCLQLMLHE